MRTEAPRWQERTFAQTWATSAVIREPVESADLTDGIYDPQTQRWIPLEAGGGSKTKSYRKSFPWGRDLLVDDYTD
jgi:hypothetical protein